MLSGQHLDLSYKCFKASKKVLLPVPSAGLQVVFIEEETLRGVTELIACMSLKGWGGGRSMVQIYLFWRKIKYSLRDKNPGPHMSLPQ